MEFWVAFLFWKFKFLILAGMACASIAMELT